MIKDINGKRETLKLVVRIYDLWCVEDRDSTKHIEMILLDAKMITSDSAIFATISRRNRSQHVLTALEYCNANFTSYFTPTFWSNIVLSATSAEWKTCYFNTRVMVIDVEW
ncbi:hypothetical protein Fmac_017608 [Flemingia macrophylla]|uniref:Uncharacterized protein n=1 Tax=Flemingia macrophylla TaxID=520843 RepID=A0ABD1M2L1_9FABA